MPFIKLSSLKHFLATYATSFNIRIVAPRAGLVRLCIAYAELLFAEEGAVFRARFSVAKQEEWPTLGFAEEYERDYGAFGCYRAIVLQGGDHVILTARGWQRCKIWLLFGAVGILIVSFYPGCVNECPEVAGLVRLCIAYAELLFAEEGAVFRARFSVAKQEEWPTLGFAEEYERDYGAFGCCRSLLAPQNRNREIPTAPGWRRCKIWLLIDVSGGVSTSEILDTPRNEFIFYADRLIRLIVEEGLNQLPYEEVTVTTPTGHSFHGVKFLRGNCGVSVVRSGEAMERGLRDCCRSIRIGKILIQANNEDGSNDVKVYYAKLPPNISQRKILLMYPILGSGNTVLKALDVLRTYDVPIENVILLTLFVSPEGLRNVLVRNPVLRVVTSEVHPVVPTHFGQRYFGTS
ncbi:Uracil phosphoribosyltransferase [Clonorchis sinensis]|uniref:Uracil phosphoribosyltransferase n=1 Tax=Clonorchis sinensis TaxID=79923 RepID=A0A3R7DA70_CLOSI|nr:Uracil phosphoribosyltransferase [Clonorchis sinensis]